MVDADDGATDDGGDAIGGTGAMTNPHPREGSSRAKGVETRFADPVVAPPDGVVVGGAVAVLVTSLDDVVGGDVVGGDVVGGDVVGGDVVGGDVVRGDVVTARRRDAR